MQSDFLTTIVLPFSLFIIMFGLGLSLKIADFKAVVKHPKAITAGLIGQMIILPLLAFVIALVFSLPPEFAVGLMIIALAPGGATSNMFSYLSKGDVALSVSLTAVAGTITPFTIPLVVAFSISYFMGDGSNIAIPILKTIVQLLIITVIPVILGMFFLRFWENTAKKTENILKWFSIVFLFTIIALVVAKNSENLAGFFVAVGAASLLLNILAIATGYYLAKLTKLAKPQLITLGFEVGIQNGTLAMVVAGSLLGNTNMMIPAVVYSLLMFFTGAAFGWWVNSRP